MLKEELAEVFNRGFWNGYYLGQRLGEWSAVYGSQATRRKEYVGKVTNWFNRIGVAEVQMESGRIDTGDDIAFIGRTTGILEMQVKDLRVELKPVEAAVKGERCSIAVPLDGMPVDHVNDNPDMTPGEVLHPRRGDRVYKIIEA